VRPVQVLSSDPPATVHGYHEHFESVSRAWAQQVRELRHTRFKEEVKKTSWSSAEPLEFAP